MPDTWNQNMPDLLLELFSEEIPARMQTSAAEELRARLVHSLGDARLEHGAVHSFVTPRRLAVRVEELPAVQPDREVERKGPRVTAPAQAIEGFCASTGLKRETLDVRGDTYFAVIREEGKPAAEALKPLIEDILKNFPWPKSQRWGSYSMQWVRPLRSILCVLDNDIIPLAFGHLTAGNTTFGHRFLAPDALVIHSPAEYESVLHNAKVLADAALRKERIRTQALAAAAAQGVEVRLDEGLLEEVTGLVEWPVCLMGKFDEQYLSLPPEVLILEMKHHQKYFACHEKDGSISRHFLLVSNMVTADGGAAIVQGNQRVLRARLDDGRFYWEHDRDTPLARWESGLEKMIFHAKLGTVAEKVSRITALVQELSIGADTEQARRAATLCKSDLVSGMVGQFPELQGVMGRYYALAQGENAEIADAVRDHYKPVGAEDDVPTAPVSIAVALADKLDTLAGLFAAGEKPTGSKDPFALRRAALGVIRILLTHRLRLPLASAIRAALRHYSFAVPPTTEAELLAFFSDRLKVLLKGEGVRHDLSDAVFALGEDDLVRLVARVRALESFLATVDGANLLAAYTRACNILKKEEKKYGVPYNGTVDAAHLAVPEEQALHAALGIVRESVERALEQENFAEAMQQMATLRQPVDRFFEAVIVNAEDPVLRANRLHLLARIRRTLDSVANFSKIEG
jgi:glycyl-tRNA synthetase beta chain